MYKVVEVKYYTESGNKEIGYQILKNNLPMFTINKFLELKGMRSDGTAKQYAYRLRKFLIFLSETSNKSYKQATRRDVLKFLDSIMFQSRQMLKIDSGKISYGTARLYLTVIQEFYKYLEDENLANVNMNWVKKKETLTHASLYGQIWTIDAKSLLNGRIERFKGTKTHVKWYEEEERTAIADNFNTLRDKAIFLLSLEGLRNEEIITLRTQDISIDYENQCYDINIYKSKGKETGNVNSTVVVGNYVGAIIDDYINSEREVVLAQKLEDDTFIYPEELFINLKGKHAGKPITYSNCIQILKRAATRAGLDASIIKTHAGRSTKVMDYLHDMADNPDGEFTMEILRQLMRWSSLASIEPYRNTKDKHVALSVAKKIKATQDKVFKQQ